MSTHAQVLRRWQSRAGRVSRQVNDPDGIQSLINRTGRAFVPQRLIERPQQTPAPFSGRLFEPATVRGSTHPADWQIRSLTHLHPKGRTPPTIESASASSPPTHFARGHRAAANDGKAFRRPALRSGVRCRPVQSGTTTSLPTKFFAMKSVCAR